MAVSTFPSFLGIAKETTYGTAVAATSFVPVTSLAGEDIKNYTPDTGYRGSAVANYNEVPTQGWSTYSYEDAVYMDTIGIPLKGILGAEDVSGAGPFTHKFSVLNTGTYQPPSWTLSDYNGFNTRQFAGSIFSQVQFTLDASGLLRVSNQAQGLASATATKPTAAFGSKTVTAGYKGAVTIGGAGTAFVENATLTIARTVNPITAVNNSTSPTQIWGGAVMVTGQFTAIYNDDTFLTPMLGGTAQAIDISYTNGADVLTLHMTNGLFTKAPVTRGGNGWMEITVDFEAVANTTDVTVAGGGFSPILVTLVNTTTLAY